MWWTGSSLARPGLAVQPGDVLLVLEAMKMETAITAPAAATVAEVKAAQGEAVRSGQVVVSVRVSDGGAAGQAS